jgi:hypothetical protein
VDGQKCANDKHNPQCNSEYRKKRQKNKPVTKETVYCCPVPYIHEGHRWRRPVPQLLITSEENKWPNISAELCTLQGSFVYKTLNTNIK